MPQNELDLTQLIDCIPKELAEAVLSRDDIDPDHAVVKRLSGASPEVNKAVGQEGVYTLYASTAHQDRMKEIVDPKGGILDEFKLAPQVFWGHRYHDPPIGSDENIRKDKIGIIARTKLATTDRAREVQTLLSEGHLKTSSIGFIALDALTDEDEGFGEAVKEVSDRTGLKYNKPRRLIRKWLLLEHSFVGIAADPHALVIKALDGSLDLSEEMAKDLRVNDEILQLFEEHFEADEEKPYPNNHACRVRDPGLFQAGSFRTMTRNHEGKPYRVRMGRLKGKTSMTEQSYLYPKGSWTSSAARSHCSSHGGTFEAASGEGSDYGSGIRLVGYADPTPKSSPILTPEEIVRRTCEQIRNEVLYHTGQLEDPDTGR